MARRHQGSPSCARLLFLAFAIYACSYHCVGMFQKRGISDALQSMPPQQRFRADVTDMFLSNSVSGERAMGLLRNAEHAGVNNTIHLTKSWRHKFVKKNANRDLRRRMLKQSKWLKPYYAKISVIDLKTGHLRDHGFLCGCRMSWLVVLQVRAARPEDCFLTACVRIFWHAILVGSVPLLSIIFTVCLSQINAVKGLRMRS